MNHDFKDFIESSATVPAKLHSETLHLTRMSLNSGKVLTKFYLLNFIGALFTLGICPQYGFGPYGGELGIINQIMNMGPVACGLFCASIFFVGGNILSWIFLNSVEKRWIYRNEYSVLFPYVSGIFMLGMAMRQIFPGHIHHDVFSFYGSWVVGGIMISVLFYKVSEQIGRVQKVA